MRQQRRDLFCAAGLSAPLGETHDASSKQRSSVQARPGPARTFLRLLRKPRRELALMPPMNASVMYCGTRLEGSCQVRASPMTVLY